jgi:hypothetical protein
VEDFMKRFVSMVILVLLAGLSVSYAADPPTPSNPYRPIRDFPNASVIGNVRSTVTFNLSLNYTAAAVKVVNETSYKKLLEVAMQEYTGIIDIVDITWVRQNNKNFLATGRVISLDGGNRATATTGVEGALVRAANDVSKDFSPRSRIAIVQITASDRSTRDFMLGELEYILQQQGYYMVDRAQLDRIFEEQHFGTTSDIDDKTAARMGHVAGASIVITGRVDGEGNLRRLRLRALNTETAQVVGTASERL